MEPDYAHTHAVKVKGRGPGGRGRSIHIRTGFGDRTLCGRIAKYDHSPEDDPKKFPVCGKCKKIWDVMESDRKLLEGED